MPAVTCVKLMLSLSENSTVAPSAALVCFAFKFLPAWRVTLLPDLIFWSCLEAASNSPSVFAVSTTKWVFAKALATVPAVTSLPASPAAGVFTAPVAGFTKSPAITFGVNVTVSPALVAVSAVGFADTTFCTALSALAFTSANWPPFTASVLPAATLPLATPVIFLLPALMPSFFTEGPLAIVKPSLFTTAWSPALSPNVTESAVKFLFNANFTFVGSVASLVAVILLSPSTVWSAVAALANFAFASPPRDNL